MPIRKLNYKIYYLFNNTGNEIEIKTFNADSNMQWRSVNTYNDKNLLSKVDYYNSENHLRHIYTYNYDNNGQLIATTDQDQDYPDAIFKFNDRWL